MIKFCLRLILVFLFSEPELKCVAQINPPGLGESNIAGWVAFGMRQGLDSLDKKQLFLYTGLASMSTPQNQNLFHSPAMLIMNAEFYHQFRKKWQYSAALSYRVQYEFENDFPFEYSNPAYKQEFRLYSRFSNVVKLKKLKWVNTLRTDFRTFFQPDFQSWNEDFQFRFRCRSQLVYTLDKTENKRLVISAEPLFSISHFQSSDSWNSFNYREIRICLFFSFKMKNAPFTFDLGYMNNIIPGDVVHYISTDLIWTNPFGKSIFRKEAEGTIQM